MRVVVSPNQVYVRTVVLKKEGVNRSGGSKSIAFADERILHKSLSRAISSLIDKTVWNPEFQPINRPGLDGTEWVLEGIRNGRYRAFAIWHPEFYVDNDSRNAQFVSLCQALTELSGRSESELSDILYGMKKAAEPKDQLDSQ